MHSFLGRKRRKMCIVDEEDILKNKKKFSARAAGVLGFQCMAGIMFIQMTQV